MSVIKKIIFWTYPRTSWQWDVLCVLILVFIFLTPKSWFENSGFRKNQAQTTVTLRADLIGAQQDNPETERRIRQLLGLKNAQPIEWRPLKDETGRINAYQVDIR